MRRLAFAVLLLSSGASARSVQQQVGDDDPVPALLSVRGKLDGTAAILTAQYAIDVDGPIYASTFQTIELPTTAVVIGATVRGAGVERRLDLIGATDASQRFDAIAAVSEETPETRPVASQRSAILIAGSPGSVTLSIASPTSRRIHLELTLSMPTCFFRDARYAVLPAPWRARASAALRVVAKPSDELQSTCGFTPEDVWAGFAAPAASRRRSGDRLEAFAGMLEAGAERIVRVELDLAATLSEVPHDLATVLVVDGSRSMTTEERDAQRELVVSYLRKAKDTRVQVVAFARTARPLLPSWGVASRAITRIDRELRALAPRNGSNLDAGLDEAGAWLERIEGTRRVVLITDERMSTRLQSIQPATLKRGLPAGTLVHVVSAFRGGKDGVTRDDTTALASLAAATDGVSVRVHKGEHRAIDATVLIRPIAIDEITITAPGWSQFFTAADVLPCGSEPLRQLDEGVSCTWWGLGDATSGPVAIQGLVWGKRITRLLRPDPSVAVEIARELSGASSIQFNPELKTLIDRRARAVNDQWSMYAEWGGPNGLYEGFGFGMSGAGSSCCGHDMFSPGTIGRGTGWSGTAPEDLSSQLAPAVAACKLGDRVATVSIEMTMLEIVDVSLSLYNVSELRPSEIAALTTCVENAIWDSSPMLARPLSNSTHPATFGKR